MGELVPWVNERDLRGESFSKRIDCMSQQPINTFCQELAFVKEQLVYNVRCHIFLIQRKECILCSR